VIKNRIPLVLASASPRRREILSTLGFELDVKPANIDELAIRANDPATQVMNIAKAKASSIAQAGSLTVAADTSVVIDSLVLEKPIDAADARRMLGLLSAKMHLVLTAVCTVFPDGSVVNFVDETKVYFREIHPTAIEAYIASGEPFDKAGAYGVQNGFGMAHIQRIEGCYFNVMGFPASLFMKLFEERQKSLLVKA